MIRKLLEASAHTTSEVPFVAQFICQKDRWPVMNMCLNRVSSLFGPFHVFFNEARRCKSYYRSAWYLYTLTSQQNEHHGRFFVTPYKPVLSKADVGVKRLRIDLVNEQEMREICSASIKPPSWGFFNNRHGKRWDLLVKMGEMFENQLEIIEAGSVSESDASSSSTPDMRRSTWSPSGHSCLSNPRDLADNAKRKGKKHRKNIDNCIMRVHIPYPSLLSEGMQAETSSKDVVLFD